MTIESFARLVYVHSPQIARYESEDYQNVSWDTLLKILELLDVRSKVRWNSVTRRPERRRQVERLKGQISVPSEVRKKLGVGPGSVLEWDE